MIYLLTYRKNHDLHCIEWAVPASWSISAVRRSFREQFPGAELFDIRRP